MLARLAGRHEVGLQAVAVWGVRSEQSKCVLEGQVSSEPTGTRAFISPAMAAVGADAGSRIRGRAATSRCSEIAFKNARGSRKDLELVLLPFGLSTDVLEGCP